MDASERPRLVILDAMSLIHRAYHAVPRHFATSSGEPTNAVFGFTNILLRVVEELSPDHAAAAFDLPGPTFRDEMYEPYKAHREAPDDMLVAQFGRIRELLEVLGFPSTTWSRTRPTTCWARWPGRRRRTGLTSG